MKELLLRDTTPQALTEYIVCQLGTFFPDGRAPLARDLRPFLDIALERTRLCFSGIEKKKFRDGDRILFNYAHPDHYAMFLYLLANSVSRQDRANPLAFRLFYLNKLLHGLDAYHDTELPEVFQFMHPLGTILGQALYGNYFCVYQGCSIGSDESGVFPTIGSHVVLYAGASVIGRSVVGDNVVISANTMVLNQTIPSDKVVLGRWTHELDLHNNHRHVMDRRFR